MPFTPELHKLVKKELNYNVTMIKKLFNNEGTKLAFNVTTGKFSIEKYALIRTMGNFFKSGESDSATSQNLFEFPLLITFYELRKLELNINGKVKQAKESNPYRYRLFGNGTPYEAFKDVCAALVYLRDVTYTGLLKGNQRNAITDILSKATKLEKSTTQPDLDDFLADCIPFVIPEGIKSMVNKTLEFLRKDPYYSSLKAFSEAALLNNINPVEVLGKLIYRKVYSSGGEQNLDIYYNEKEYAKSIQTMLNGKNIFTHVQGTIHRQTQRKATLDDFINDTAVFDNKKSEMCDSIIFCHFFRANWPAKIVKFRVYIHLKYDKSAASALKGLKAIFQYLINADNSILGKFAQFKICNLDMLRKRTDSIVMYCHDEETARKIADGLKEPLDGLVVDDLPKTVKRISPGIGICTEPESEFNVSLKPLAPYVAEQFSYGTHRCGLIAKGLINSAERGSYILPDNGICFKNVALAFSNAGVDVYKPYHTGSLPPFRISLVDWRSGRDL